MSIFRATGFEHGVLSTVGVPGLAADTKLLTTLGSNVAASATAKRTGNYGVRANPTNATFDLRIPAGNIGAFVGVYAILFHTPPDTLDVSGVVYFGGGVAVAGDSVNFMAYDVGLGTFGARWGTAGLTPGGAVTLTLDHWYVVKWLARFDLAVRTLDWSIDGTAQPQCVSGSQTASSCSEFRFGSGLNQTMDTYLDDLVLANAAGDHPLSEYAITAEVPTAVGTHNLDAATSAFYFKNVASTETALTTSETTSYQAIDDVPLDADADRILVKAGIGAPSAAAVVQTAGTVSITNGANPTPALPSGLAAGDLMLLIVVTREVTDGSIGTPAGWTKANLGTERGTGGCIAAFWRAWQSGDAAPTVTLTNHTASNSGDSAIAQIFRISGADTSTPIGNVGTRGNFAAAQNIGAISGITLGAWGTVVVVGHKLDDWTSVAPLSGDSLTWTERADTPNTNGLDNGMVIDTAPAGSGGATVTAKTFTVTGGTSLASAGIMFEIRAGGALTNPAGTEYVEEDMPASGLSTAPTVVQLSVAVANESGTTANKTTLKAYDGTEAAIYTDMDTATATKSYRTVCLTSKPSGGAWTVAALDALRFRWGYTNDPDSRPALYGLMIEVAVPVTSGSTYTKAGYGKESG